MTIYRLTNKQLRVYKNRYGDSVKKININVIPNIEKFKDIKNYQVLK